MAPNTTFELDEDDTQFLLDMVYDRFLMAYRAKQEHQPSGHWVVFWHEEYKATGRLLKHLLVRCRRSPAGALEGVLQAAKEVE